MKILLLTILLVSPCVRYNKCDFSNVQRHNCAVCEDFCTNKEGILELANRFGGSTCVCRDGTTVPL